MSQVFTYNGELVAEILKYHEIGRDEAKQFRPPSDATQPDSNEATLAAEARSWVGREQRVCDSVVGAAIQTGSEVTQKLADYEGRAAQLAGDASLESEIKAELASEHASLVSLVVKRIRTEVDLKYFQAKHQIKMSARYPESRIFHISLVLAFALVETVINSVFFENQHGLLGGFAVAAVVSAINIGGAFGLGFWGRYKNWMTPKYMVLFGWFCIAFFPFFSAYCNALFAAFRAEYQLIADPSNTEQLGRAFKAAAESAWGLFSSLTLNFKDFWSALLFISGFILSLFAFSKGYSFSDRYPDHEHHDRELKTALEWEMLAFEESRQKMQAVLRAKEAEIQSAIQEPTTFANLLGGKLSEIATAAGKFNVQVESIQADVKNVIGAYRDSNISIRGSMPVPVYFSIWPDVKTFMNLTLTQECRRTLESLQEECSKMRDDYQSKLGAKLEKVRRERADLHRALFEDFRTTVVTGAQQEIDRQTPQAKSAESQNAPANQITH